MASESMLLDIIKRTALNAVESKRPMNLYFGTVISEKPLKIQIDQKKILSENFLVLSRNVTDYEVQMTVNHVTEKMSGGAKDPSFTSHLHQYKGTKPFKVLNALKVGEVVILISMQGGQKYFVMDRVGG